MIETSGVELTVRMDGEIMLQNAGTASYGMQVISFEQVHVPFPPGAERCGVEIDCQVLDSGNALYSPAARVTSMRIADGSTVEHYHTVEEKLQQTAAMRQEWKNQVATPCLLQQIGCAPSQKKYGSVLDASYTDDRFTAQAALKIR